MVKLGIKLTFIEECLGMGTPDPETYAAYIAANKPAEQESSEERKDRIKEEVDSITKKPEEKEGEDNEEDEEVEEKTLVFPKDDDNNPIFFDYQIIGYFKESAKALNRCKGEDFAKETTSIKAFKSVINDCFFVFPRKVKINIPEGKEMGSCTRSIRCETAQGPRIALGISETVPEGSTCEFEVLLLSDKYRNFLIECLNYGFLRGTGGWRNSGKGKFTYEILSEEKVDSIPNAHPTKK